MKFAYRMMLMVLAGLLLPACAISRPLQIEPVSAKGTTVQPAFKTVHYRMDRDRTVHVISEASGTDRATGQPVRQILVMRIFWEPVGGTTSLNPTSLNMTFRYLVMTADAMGQYEGAGFVRFFDKLGKDKLRLRVMDSDMRLTEKTENFKDILERCRVRGSLTARRDDAGTMDQTLAAQQEFFYKTLARSRKPTTEPAGATAPAAQP